MDQVLELALFFVIAIITIVAAGIFGKKLGIATPLILIVIGAGLSFVQGAPVSVPSEIVLFVLLPPILYASAISVPVIDFRRNFPSIGVLSVLLVIATTFITGALLWAVFPTLSFAAAVAVGAVVSPTDAVAATAIAKRFGLPPRLVTILEGESLVNDATALVLLRSAIAATAATVTFWDALGDFAFAVTVAIAVGVVVGFITVWVRSRLNDPLLDTAISFAVPFIAFLPAEQFGASGVIAVVTVGLYSGYHSSRRFSPQSRTTERTNWRSIQFLLENGVFLLMGLELTNVVGNVRSDDLSVPVAVLLGILVTVVVIATRYLFVGPLLLILRRQERRALLRHERSKEYLERIPAENITPRQERRLSAARRVLGRRGNDIKQLHDDGLEWRGGIILGWAGMRGVVTLAAAQSLPDDIPHRNQLVLIAFTVAVVTLLVQGGTLPWLIRMLGVQGSDATADRREFASLLAELNEAGLQVLEDATDSAGEPVDPAIIERVRHDTEIGTNLLHEQVEAAGDPEKLADLPLTRYRMLRYDVLRAERDALLIARSEGRYASRILVRAQTVLDLEETRLAQFDTD
ncbi:CPA1 family monovalent cation:H+ antiporter [Leifsonia sp. AK011]|uniref:cation:proton antiporter n=1 Tax=Leifsonia sp. AK011 TaxID=2723075 RepID=UPI0015CBD19B|nr:sodium:proton antiporter [Leifsonia sp. AK011]NYF11226.1 CPA1 family monovalent cation:H+ antiporter [Leifsonia sp. AK011]